MGCQCANKDVENNSEIKKYQEEDNEQFQVSNNNMDSNSKEGIFVLDQNPDLNPDIPPSEQKFQENLENTPPVTSEKNEKYLDYPQKMLELINKIREDPVSYADVIEDSIQYIYENPERDVNSKKRIIFKKKVKVALNRGEVAFQEAIEELKNMESLPPLELKNEICVPLPEREEEIKDSSYLREKIRILREENNIDVFFKDLIKIPEVSVLLMIVDDSEKNPGKKRQAVLNKEFKYIGISSKFIGKTFIAYFAFSK